MTNEKLLNDQLDRPGQSPTTPLFKTKKIDGTPFHILNKDGDLTLIMGKHILSPNFKTEQEILDYINYNQWNLQQTVTLIILQTIGLIQDIHTLTIDKTAKNQNHD